MLKFALFLNDIANGGPMLSQIHETHTYPSPLLPFIYHRDMGPSSQYGMANWHTNIELLYVRSGQGFVLYEGEEIAMHEGDTVVINTNCLHSVRADADSPGRFLYDCLIIDREFCIQNGVDTVTCHFVTHFHDIAMKQRMDELCAAWDAGTSSAVAIRASVLGTLAYILTKTTGSVTPPAPDASYKNHHVKRAIRYMEENLSEALSLSSTADAIGISRCHLAHLFRKSTGMSVVAYIQMLRCRHAVVLLGQSDLSIAEIAHECGFESVSYFDRCFTRLYGQTPRQIRARRT
jgi:AraC-like DNA-binding protein